MLSWVLLSFSGKETLWLTLSPKHCHWLLDFARYAIYNSNIHSLVLLEDSKTAGGSPEKAGVLLAKWATPEFLAPLNFRAHPELAENHRGGWGYKNVHCTQVEFQAQALDATKGTINVAQDASFQKALTMHLQN